VKFIYRVFFYDVSDLPVATSTVGEEEPSNDLEDINLYSARMVIMVSFGVNSIQFLGVRSHLLSLPNF
jgi:hypothetical protein